MRKSQKLAQELARNPGAGFGERHLSRNVLRHLCAEADELIGSGDERGLRVARLCCRLAGRLTARPRRCLHPGRCEEWALGFAQLAAALRSEDRLAHAERALQIAFDAATPELEGDLYRRRAWLRLYQGRMDDARDDARQGVLLTTGRDHARALGTLGVVLIYRGEHNEAIHQLELCLETTLPEDEHRYCNALHNYALALSKGDSEQAEKAVELCGKLRSRFKNQHKMQRAKTWWLEGLLHERLGDADTAWRTLDIARRSLAFLGAAPEVAAIVADMARVSPQPLAVQHICYEAAKVIPDAHPLAVPLGGLAGACEEGILDASATLRQAASSIVSCPGL